jgi:predicted transcriptional regulator
MAAMKATSRETKKLFTVRLDEPVIRDLKLLSVDLDRPISNLLAEAIADVVRKHGRTEVVYSTVTTESKKDKK